MPKMNGKYEKKKKTRENNNKNTKIKPPKTRFPSLALLTELEHILSSLSSYIFRLLTVFTVFFLSGNVMCVQ